ncbi:MAG: preprotein translocase subunit YajC [Rhodospirillales bacterium]|jgi:preprotein translocase subunit YajC|nr:preprotein translocase subunit YajC [Rhodospirillales bacterium]
MFVSTAYAQASADQGGALGSVLVPMILILVVFYFFLIRPQQKKAKQHKEMLNAMRRGDKVVTGGGITGTVSKVIDDNEVQVEISQGVRVRVQRSLIASVITKGEPVKAAPRARTNGKDKAESGADAGEGAETPPPAQQETGVGGLLKSFLGGRGR